MNRGIYSGPHSVVVEGEQRARFMTSSVIADAWARTHEEETGLKSRVVEWVDLPDDMKPARNGVLLKRYRPAGRGQSSTIYGALYLASGSV
jgi:hypothetical protein